MSHALDHDFNGVPRSSATVSKVFTITSIGHAAISCPRVLSTGLLSLFHRLLFQCIAPPRPHSLITLSTVMQFSLSTATTHTPSHWPRIAFQTDEVFRVPSLGTLPIAMYPLIHLSATLLAQHACSVVTLISYRHCLSRVPTFRGFCLCVHVLTCSPIFGLRATDYFTFFGAQVTEPLFDPVLVPGPVTDLPQTHPRLCQIHVCASIKCDCVGPPSC